MSRIQFVNLPTDKEQCNGCFSRTQMGKLEDPSSRPAPSAAKNPAVNIQAALAGCNQPQAQAAQPRPSHIVKWRILCSCLQPPGGQLKFPPQTHAGCFSRLQSSSKKQPRPVTQADAIPPGQNFPGEHSPWIYPLACVTLHSEDLTTSAPEYFHKEPSFVEENFQTLLSRILQRSWRLQVF